MGSQEASIALCSCIMAYVDVPHNEENCVAPAPAAQNELTGEATIRKRHARDSALLIKCTEFYEFT
jgi:hypothetical protein